MSDHQPPPATPGIGSIASCPPVRVRFERGKVRIPTTWVALAHQVRRSGDMVDRLCAAQALAEMVLEESER